MYNNIALEKEITKIGRELVQNTEISVYFGRTIQKFVVKEKYLKIFDSLIFTEFSLNIQPKYYLTPN